MEYENIKKVIESCHLNFLIGSGASKNFLDTLQGVEDALDNLNMRKGLSEAQNNKLILKLIEVSIKYFYFKKCMERNIELLNVTDEPNETMNNYVSLLNSLQKILTKRNSNIISKQVNLFTTNIDVFLDIALEKCGYAFNDGFSGRMNPKFSTENFHNIINKVSSYYEYQSVVPLFNLFKLHGSLNWKLDNDLKEIRYDSQLTILNKLSEIIFSKEELVNCFDDDGKSLNLSDIYRSAETKDISQYEPKLEQFLKENNKLLMINPDKDKFEETTLKLYYYELLRMFSNNLEKENSVLFVTGFSFADEHIRAITLRVAKSNPTLLIIIFAFDKEAKEYIRDNLNENEIANIIFLTNEVDNYSLKEVNNKIFGRVVKDFFDPSIKEDTKSNLKKESDGK